MPCKIIKIDYKLAKNDSIIRPTAQKVIIKENFKFSPNLPAQIAEKWGGKLSKKRRYNIIK